MTAQDQASIQAALQGAKLAVVLVTFNRLSALQNSLTQILAAGATQVLVVNNASTDGTGAWLDSLTDPRVQPLHLADNTGGAGGFEAGMAQISRQAAPPDWILLLDDDAWPEPQALARFAAMAPTLPPQIGAVAAAVYLPDGTIAEMNRPGYNPFWHPKMIWQTLTRGNRAGFKLPDQAYAETASAKTIDNASFVGYFVARQAWEKAGLPEGGLFIYGDDVLYSLRLRRAGFDLLFAPNLRFTHDCQSIGKGFVYRPLWKVYYHCRNGVSIARQAAGPLVFPLALVWYLLLWARRGRHAPPEDRAAYRKMMWSGVWDGLLGRRGRNDALHR